jgi:SulP family sulfate permease
MLIAVVVASIIVGLFQLPVETIGTKFGGLPRVPLTYCHTDIYRTEQ